MSKISKLLEKYSDWTVLVKTPRDKNKKTIKTGAIAPPHPTAGYKHLHAVLEAEDEYFVMYARYFGEDEVNENGDPLI